MMFEKYIISGPALLCALLLACTGKKTCPYKPAPIFEKGLPHVQEYNFERKDNQSLESLLLDTGVLLEIGQDVCETTRQEYRFIVKGDYSQYPDSLWFKEAARQLVFLSTLSPKQAALKDWADILEIQRHGMQLGAQKEIQPGIFMRLDRVVSPQESTLVLLMGQL
jgi:hypothetical protein